MMVMDTYTRRVFSRLGLIAPDAAYEVMQEFFMSRLPCDLQLFNEYHALIDGLANQLCLKQTPRCGECPLLELCPTGQEPDRTKAPPNKSWRGGEEARHVAVGARHL
ncbi:MAG: hypothetical protein ACYC5Y_04720 [Symbiobacteriia bacterium]